MLDDSRIEHFRTNGLLKLPGFFDAATMPPMREKVWAFLEARDNVCRNDPASWPAITNPPAGAARPTKLIRLNTDPAFNVLDTTALLDTLRALAGSDVTPFPGAGHRQVLFTYPETLEWALPHNMWHADLPHAIGRKAPTGLQAFLCLDEVRPTGGGTIVLSGSHRALVNQSGQAGQTHLPSSAFKKWLARKSDYVSALFAKDTPNRNRFLNQPGMFDEIELQPVELIGAPGDLYIMDMRCLHSLAPNAQNTPRIMLTERFQVAS
ncbi:MAG: phytanoyl-CoA dioxygenase family protein [Alphaproteobacteria bacterium]